VSASSHSPRRHVTHTAVYSCHSRKVKHIDEANQSCKNRASTELASTYAISQKKGPRVEKLKDKRQDFVWDCWIYNGTGNEQYMVRAKVLLDTGCANNWISRKKSEELGFIWDDRNIRETNITSLTGQSLRTFGALRSGWAIERFDRNGIFPGLFKYAESEFQVAVEDIESLGLDMIIGSETIKEQKLLKSSGGGLRRKLFEFGKKLAGGGRKPNKLEDQEARIERKIQEFTGFTRYAAAGTRITRKKCNGRFYRLCMSQEFSLYD